MSPHKSGPHKKIVIIIIMSCKEWVGEKSLCDTIAKDIVHKGVIGEGGG